MTPPTEPDVNALLVEVMAAAADQRRRAATRLAADLEADRRQSKDVRAGAVKVVRILAEAAQLDGLAADLNAGRRELLLMPDDATVQNIVRQSLEDGLTDRDPAGRALTVVPPPAEVAAPADVVDEARAEAEAVLTAEFGEVDADGLPAGQGEDDDPDPEVDVAQLDAFDAAVPTETLER